MVLVQVADGQEQRPRIRRRLQQPPVEARAITRVTRGTDLFHQRQQGIAVAVVAQFAHLLNVAGRLTLVPQRPSRTAPEPGGAGLQCLVKRFTVHVGEHEDLAGGPLLHDAGHEPVRPEDDGVDGGRVGDGGGRVDDGGVGDGAVGGGGGGGGRRSWELLAA